jgi:hypothetical protein
MNAIHTDRNGNDFGRDGRRRIAGDGNLGNGLGCSLDDWHLGQGVQRTDNGTLVGWDDGGRSKVCERRLTGWWRTITEPEERFMNPFVAHLSARGNSVAGVFLLSF